MEDKLWTCYINSEGHNNQYKKVRIYFISDSFWELLGMPSHYVTSVVTWTNFKLCQLADCKNSN